MQATSAALPAPPCTSSGPSAQYGGFYRSCVHNAGTGGYTGIRATMQGFFGRTSQNLPTAFSFRNAYRLTSYANPAFYHGIHDNRDAPAKRGRCRPR